MQNLKLGPWSLVVVLCCVALLAAGCGRIEAARPASNPDIVFSLAVQPNPPVVGPAELVVTLLDRAGKPVEGARLEVEGNMTHAGMQPAFGQGAGGQGGRYAVPMNWTMSGDWVVTVKATMPGGQTASKDFSLRVGE